MTKREGPLVTVKLSCDGCRYERSESYRVQSDSGHSVYCDHPGAPPPARVGDTDWTTPQWCPFRRALAPLGIISLLVALAACNGDGKPAPIAAAAPPPMSPQCQAVARVLDAADRCTNAPPAERGRGLRAQLATASPRWCALILGEYHDELAYRRCPVDLGPEEQGWIFTERTRRTRTPPDLGAADLAAVDAVASWRNRVCACQDTSCTRALAGESPPPMKGASKASEPARDAAMAMFEEAGVCHRILEHGMSLTYGRRY